MGFIENGAGVCPLVSSPVCPVNTVRWFNLPPLGTFITRYQLLGGRWVAPQLADARILVDSNFILTLPPPRHCKEVNKDYKRF